MRKEGTISSALGEEEVPMDEADYTESSREEIRLSQVMLSGQ